MLFIENKDKSKHSCMGYSLVKCSIDNVIFVKTTRKKDATQNWAEDKWCCQTSLAHYKNICENIVYVHEYWTQYMYMIIVHLHDQRVIFTSYIL